MRPSGGTIPGRGAFPGQEHDRQEDDRREPNMRGLELTGRPGAVR
jgi:hypothetical protein